jgi:hypothetical protein
MRGSHVKEKGLEKGQNVTKAEDCGWCGHCSARASHYRLAAYDGLVPSALGHKIGLRSDLAKGGLPLALITS